MTFNSKSVNSFGMMPTLLTLLLYFGSFSALVAQNFGLHQHPILDSGGPLIPEQASFNVTFYELDVEIFPETRRIEGVLTAIVDVVHPMSWLVLDLDTVFTIHNTGVLKASLGSSTLISPDSREKSKLRQTDFFANESTHHRDDGRIWIELDRTYQPGERIVHSIHYSGAPRVAPNPPWDGGFSWAKTPDGSPWIGVSCQTQGADLWWPVKDHPSDRPDSMQIRITVPDPLVAASNGRFQSVVSNADETSTWNWRVNTPISNYNVTLNIGPYDAIEDQYISTAGDTMDVIFWILPEDEVRARELFPQFALQLRFFEELLGPYPFRTEKYGVVQTSYLGMEHQTLIAYGAGFVNDRLFNMNAGYDDLHHHELAHEWWGNLVAAYDWKDFWIHEGFATYMQALYTEQLVGKERYLAQMKFFRGMVQNARPLAPRETRSAEQMYRGRDVYYKGASVLHTLRFLVGDDAFFEILRRYAYPDPALEATTDGSALRFSDTNEFRQIAEKYSQRDLKWFFDVYVHQRELPELQHEVDGRNLHLRWVSPDELPFSMSVPVHLSNGKVEIVEICDGKGTLRLPRRATFEIDPEEWLLKK
jgi:aminopeptidase N